MQVPDKTILITGCSSGIGLATARHLRAQGWQVFASCRKPEDCARLTDEGFAAPLLDYDDPETLHSALDEVLTATGGTLGALFNNGAYTIPARTEDLPTDALKTLFQSNFFGWHDLTRRVIPIMRAAGKGRIVQCSSGLGFLPLAMRGAYVSSKHALEGMTDTLRIEMRGTGIGISLIEPGPITSNFRKNGALQFKKWIDWEHSADPESYAPIHRRMQNLDATDPFELPAHAVALKVERALTSTRPRPRYRVTLPVHVFSTLKRILPTRALDWVIAKA